MCLLVGGMLTGCASEVSVPRTVPFADSVVVSQAVRDQCQLNRKVASYVKRYANAAYSDDPSIGRYVEMSISEVFALGGGSWTGPKWMTVDGTLKQDGETVASFRAKRATMGGVFAGFKGTCAMVGRTARAIGKDISVWLENPVDGARLGERW